MDQRATRAAVPQPGDDHAAIPSGDRPGWTLVWADEFDGERVDPAKWDFDLGNGFYDYKNHAWVPGWGNE